MRKFWGWLTMELMKVMGIRMSEALQPQEVDFYLKSTENLESPVRKCKVLRKLFDPENRLTILQVHISPVIIGQKYGLGDKDIDIVLLAGRHQGFDLGSIREYPIFVFILWPFKDPGARNYIFYDDYKIYDWG